MQQRSVPFLLALLLPCLQLAAQVNDEPIINYSELHHPQYDTQGMVAAQNEIASRVGAEILAQGGNAVDAAVAVGFALAVTTPRAGNIGGGGFMLLHLAASNETVAIDYREMAPPRASRDMYLDEDGNVDNDKARFSHLSSGVPGTVAGLHLALTKYGTMPWKDVIEPAMRLARDGIIVSYDLAENLRARRERLGRNEASRNAFYKPDGQPYAPGELFRQKDLARTLQEIATNGPDAFYRGKIAALIVAEMERGGGLIDAEALAAYRPVERRAVRGSYRDFEIVAMPPPSSGGLHVIQMLNILEHFPVARLGAGSADNIHLLAEVSRLAFADRSKHLGDPDYYEVPQEWLISKDYARQLAATIDLQRARPSADVAPGVAPAYESPDTTHFSVIDRDGNVVANTYTLNFSYGNHVTVPGAGFLLNNEMDDFVSAPGIPNAFGMLGGEANEIQPGKRPLSSMTPVIVFKDGVPVLATGSPGGSRIISAVLQMLVNVIDHGMNIADATDAPRIHHQWYPDQLQLEPGISPDTIALLRAKGHTIGENSWAVGSLQSVARRGGMFYGASDPRRPAAAAVGAGAINCPLKVPPCKRSPAAQFAY